MASEYADPGKTPEVKKRDPLRPLLAAAVFVFFYWFADNVAATIAQFLGRDMVALTVPRLVAAAARRRARDGDFRVAQTDRPGPPLGRQRGTESAGRPGGRASAEQLASHSVPAAVFGPGALTNRFPNADASWSASVFTVALLFCGAAGEEIAFRGFPAPGPDARLRVVGRDSGHRSAVRRHA